MAGSAILLPFAVALSLAEALAQMSLKASSADASTYKLALGFGLYCLVALTLYSSYVQGLNLSSVQVTWSILSSLTALASGVMLFNEPLKPMLPSLFFLTLAIFCLPKDEAPPALVKTD